VLTLHPLVLPPAAQFRAVWSCTTFDARGRTTSQTWPAFNGAPARTVTYGYAAVPSTANPLIATVTDPSGTITGQVDLLSRVVAYWDVWGQQTNVSYDVLGRVTSTTGPQGLIANTYDPGNARLASVTLDGANLVTNIAYSTSTGRLLNVAYANSTTLTVGYDPYGSLTSETFTGPGSSRVLGDQITKSLAGRVIDQTTDTGGANLVDFNPAGPNYSYDAAGRLTGAAVDANNETWSFGAQSPTYGCTNPWFASDFDAEDHPGNDPRLEGSSLVVRGAVDGRGQRSQAAEEVVGGDEVGDLLAGDCGRGHPGRRGPQVAGGRVDDHRDPPHGEGRGARRVGACARPASQRTRLATGGGTRRDRRVDRGDQGAGDRACDRAGKSRLGLIGPLPARVPPR
jgi:YD repeat-containing protein